MISCVLNICCVSDDSKHFTIADVKILRSFLLVACEIMASSLVGQKRRRSGKRCVVMFCNKTNEDNVSLHQFPRDPSLCQKWNKFVLAKRDGKAWTPGTGHICSDHFLANDYEGYGAKLAGFSSKLVLKKGAVPSIQATPTPEQLQKARKIYFHTPSPSPSPGETTPRRPDSRGASALTKLRAHRVSYEIMTIAIFLKRSLTKISI